MSKKIKILHVIQHMHSGGVEQRKLLIAQNLPKEKFEQKIICSAADAQLKQKFLDAGCEVFEVGQLKHPFDWKVHKKAIKIIKNYKPEIIHGSVFEGVTIAALCGYYCNVPVRIIEETSFPNKRSKRANVLFNFFSTLVHKVIAISPTVEEYLLKTVKVKQQKVKMIFNGVKNPITLNQEQKEKLKSELGIKKEEIVLGSVGRMENDVKGFDRLIDTFNYLVTEIPNIRLMIVGTGQLLNEYKNQAKAIGIENQIKFLGYQSNVNDYYQIMDFYLSFPRSEGFGISVVEAMSHGLPVIVEEIGGLKDIVDHRKNGFLINHNNQILIKKTIQELKDNIHLKTSISKNAEKSHEILFSRKVYLQKVNNLYLELI